MNELVDATVTTQADLLGAALKTMVDQHCDRDGDVYRHTFMSADEEAFEVLVKCHLAEWADANHTSIRFLDGTKK